MSEKIAELLNAISRVPTQLLFALAVTSAFILFIPEDLASTLAVDEFRKSYRIYLGPGLVLIGAWLVARSVTAAGGLFKQWKVERLRKQGLESLTAEEKGYLAVFILEESTTIYAPIDDGIVGGLLARQIVFRSSNIFDLVEGVPYNLQPWARQHLVANPHLLAGAVGGPVTLKEKLRADRW